MYRKDETRGGLLLTTNVDTNRSNEPRHEMFGRVYIPKREKLNDNQVMVSKNFLSISIR